MNFSSNPKVRATHGFTLIELLVVVGIFIVITSVVLSRQNKFSSDILLSDLAYQIAISVRQAQVYGLGVRGAGTGLADITYDTGYGINFAGTLPLANYTFFPDLDKDGIADTTETDLGTAGTLRYDLSRNQRISAVCGTSNNGNTCLPAASSLNVIYIRPNPAAIITDSNGTVYNTLVITVQSSIGDRYKCITVYSTGQVAVSNPLSTGQWQIAGPNPCVISVATELDPLGGLGGSGIDLP